ncbi:MAG: LuxR family transcriptional regulator [Pseudomonadales bacterium]|nr:LuxR family transcriptional regulator [Pseudomonadales bacterium]
MTRTTSEATDPRLLLKATPPKAPKSLLARPRLSVNGPELADKAVIAVHAGSGFGKTALLAQWRRERLEAGDVVAWLTLDHWDDDTRFSQGLAVAMQAGSGRPRFGCSWPTMSDQRDGRHEGITGWLAGVVDMAAEVVLILDEAHTLPEATVRSSLVYLLHNAPANLKIVMASRRPLSLPVADLLAHGQFASLDTEALRLRPQETVAVLSARFGARIDADTCIRLHEITEGWPLGLQLAIAAIEKSQSVRDAIDGCLSCSGDIRRYFVESLVERLPPAMADFLVRTSFVDALHPELCEAITAREDSARMLSQLCELTPIFAESVGSDWLRIHPLAREFLDERFDALPAQEQRGLRARAAQWLSEQRMFEEAGRHALAAGQEELAYELAERCLYDVVTTGQLSRVAEWIGRIPATEIERRPRLRVAVAWTLAQSERHVEAARMVGPIIDDPAADAGERCESAEICATAALFADDLDAVERVVSPWFETLSSRSAVQRTVGTNHMALLALLHGSPERARYHYQHLPRDSEWGGGYARGWGDWIVGMSYLWEGQVVLGEQHLRAALARAEEKTGRRGPIAVMLAAVLAAVLWERNGHDEVAALLANRLDAVERHAPPDAIVLGYVAAARAAAAQGQEGRAFDLLEHLFALGEARHLPRPCIASLAEQMRIHALRAREDACAALLGRLDEACAAPQLRDQGLPQPLVGLQSGLARTYASLARQDWQAMLGHLQAIHAVAERLRRGRDLIQIQLLEALALTRLGKENEALFAEALGMAKTLGLERILVDTHPDLAARAERTGGGRAVEAGTAGRLPERREAVAVARPGDAAHARVAPSALLTPKEREILRLLANNMSNKQIAIALGVGAETVKWHLKNLFGKLYAANRKHLLDRARMLGILDSAA